jgi:hypothetical protein
MHLAAFGQDHQLDQCLCDLRLESFGVSFAEADDVGNEQAVTAIRINVDLGLAGFGSLDHGRVIQDTAPPTDRHS